MNVQEMLTEIKRFHDMGKEQASELLHIGTGTLEHWADTLEQHLSPRNDGHSESSMHEVVLRPVLLPCPYCGSTNIDSKTFEAFVVCKGCDADGPVATNYVKSNSVELWNKRARKQMTQPPSVVDGCRMPLTIFNGPHPVRLGEIVEGKRVVMTCWEWTPESGNVPVFRLDGESELRKVANHE
jgi:Lar family restriction alleviation protein